MPTLYATKQQYSRYAVIERGAEEQSGIALSTWYQSFSTPDASSI